MAIVVVAAVVEDIVAYVHVVCMCCHNYTSLSSVVVACTSRWTMAQFPNPQQSDVVASGGSDSKRRRKRRPKSNSEKKLTVTGITNKNQNKTTTSAVIAIAVGLSFACTYHTET